MTAVGQKPELSKTFPHVPTIWTCPITGLEVPKDPQKNLIYRRELLQKAENNPDLQAQLMKACADSTLFYLNTFCFTYRQEDIDPKTGRKIPTSNVHVPFVTWDIQDEATEEVEKAILGGYDIGLDKSREMGASWLLLAILHKHWLFRPDSQILILSRTENYVDQAGNHKSLFWKLDYLNQWLPDWMRPPNCLVSGRGNRTKMHLKNELNGSVIDGESTTDNAARGDRRFVVLLDEFGAVQNGQAMRSATADVTPCRIVNSTPQAGSEYSKWITSGQIKVVGLPWWEHPEKGLGRYVVQDETTKKWIIRSPWYDYECTRRSPNEIASELDRDHLGAGDVFFEHHILDQHKALFTERAKCRLRIDWKPGTANDNISRFIRGRQLDKINYKPFRKGKVLKIWTTLTNFRPDQTKNYIMGIDISKGQGASNSVISIRCKETKQKIAEWADATTPPYEFARIAVAIAIWCGGSNPQKLPTMIWEANGDTGIEFGKLIVHVFNYPFYYRDHQIGRIDKKKTKKYGFHSNPDKKRDLLTLYRRLLAHGGFINPSRKALEEAATYVRYTGGGIGPAHFIEESTSARATHGDRVIADALSAYIDSEIPRTKYMGISAPKNSIGYRKQQALRRKRQQHQPAKSWREPFDFRNTKRKKSYAGVH